MPSNRDDVLSLTRTLADLDFTDISVDELDTRLELALAALPSLTPDVICNCKCKGCSLGTCG